jgi:DNA-binding NtrC family response regulator
MPDARDVLIVEDSAVRELATEALGGDDWSIETVPDLRAAEDHLHERRCDVLVTGPGASVSEEFRTLRRVRRAHPKAKVIVLTAVGEPGHVITALQEHAFSYFSRPFVPADARDDRARACRAGLGRRYRGRLRPAGLD